MGVDKAKPRGTIDGVPTESERGIMGSENLRSIPITELGNQTWKASWGQRAFGNWPNRKVWPGNYPSFELKGPDPHTKDPYTAVSFWLFWQRPAIIQAEMKWKIDRRAIAGVIAWEALNNPSSASLKAVGPGKIHLKRSNNGD